MKNKSVKRELNPIQQSLFAKLKDIMLVDQRRLSARIHGIGKIKSQEAQQAVAAEIQLQIEQAQLRVENRKSARPASTMAAILLASWGLSGVL